MSFYNGYKNGINLGGWLSQFYIDDDQDGVKKAKHFKSFITEHDIERIASWGGDHVRLPLMADVIHDADQTDCLKEEGIRYVDQCIEWCEKYHINILLDLHELDGHCNMGTELPPVLKDEKIVNRCATIWKLFAKRYKGRNNPMIVFELLNEVHYPTSYVWIKYYTKMVEAIREIDKDRIIMIGTNDANSVFRFPELKLLEDDNIVYNFHFYDPLVFTHQAARFSEEHMAFGKKIHYPGEIKGYVEFLQKHPDWGRQYPHTALDTVVDKTTMLKYLRGVFDFIKYTGKEVYCGEFGVVDSADLTDRCAWVKDFIEILDENKIGHAYWNYKIMDFGLIDIEDNIISKELVKAVFGIEV